MKPTKKASQLHEYFMKPVYKRSHQPERRRTKEEILHNIRRHDAQDEETGREFLGDRLKLE